MKVLIVDERNQAQILFWTSNKQRHCKIISVIESAPKVFHREMLPGSPVA
jgi:hypothetical protein